MSSSSTITTTTTTKPIPGLTDTSRTPHVKLHGVGFRDMQWTRGFWADETRLCRDAMVPAMLRLMSETERHKFVGNFEIAAGLAKGKHHGAKWDDGDFFKWFEAVAALHAANPDSKFDAMMDQFIDLVSKAQEPDGYFHTDYTIRRRAGEPATRFANPMEFEMYNMGHLMVAACVHHRATGKTSMLTMARKAADYLCEEFKSPTPEQARHGICPMHLSGLIEMYRTTREPRYRDLAVTLLNMRDLVTKGDDDNQDRIPFRKQTLAIGHAVRATYLYTGAADIYTETGDESLLAPLKQIWDDLIAHKLYITGGCGALYDGASPDGSEDQAVITRVHQSFGRNYQLPQSTAHNETCGAIGNLLWNWRMLQISGDSRFGDVIEQTLFNSVLAGMSLDGKRFFYTNTLRQISPMPVELRWPRSRTETLDCFCCPPNVVRTVAEVGQYAYARSGDGVALILYGGSQLRTSLPDGSEVALTQETDYPWDGRVKITIDRAPGAEFTLSMRIPAWATGVTVRVNGKVATGAQPKPGTFHAIRRAWAMGDVVELDLPMPPRLVEANPYVEEARNQVAVVRGPIVYCLESPDLPAGVRVNDVYVPRDVKLTPVANDKSLAGATVLRGKLLAYPRGEWSKRLYREFTPAPPREIETSLVPYYAWDNRGESEMSVFLPLA